ncbi:DUF1365 domain-containing protein [Aeoliella mucimassa]|uniref:DUF1365 domain-containing protein n=1 Tax=Aeoliella mucimassa TaxID=2527972 RepID=A0A518ANI5_9BACT|nr:DUF1365 domain-containing protein [Aeoliella mucimassa]QDU56283.1 hypothetical protein Pan181_24920 [Aeoliella mucimassa]
MNSCIYRSSVSHRRRTPVEHQFRYRLFWLYIDLEEWPVLSRQVTGLSDRRFAPAALWRNDHLGDRDTPLQQSVRQLVHERTGADLANGPIRLLTQPRSLGFYFSPLNMYYCFDQHETLTAVVAEVNNTPWGEQHCYVLWSDNQTAPGCYRHAKTFHVSPFMGMDQSYVWQVQPPDEQFQLHLATERSGQAYFDAAMNLERRPLTSGSLMRHLATSPINAGRVLSAIYFEAFRLWMKRCPYFPHPKNQSTATPTSQASSPMNPAG